LKKKMPKAEIITKEPAREMNAIVSDATHIDKEGVQCPVLPNLTPRSDAVHLVLEPTNVSWENQYELYSIRSTDAATGKKRDICRADSAIIGLLNRLNELGLLSGRLETADDFSKAVLGAMVGNEFRFMTEQVGRKEDLSWMPQELLKKQKVVE